MSAQPDPTAVSPKLGRRLRVGIAAAATVLLSAGCAAGQVAQTADEKAVIDGSNTSVGTMDLRAVAVQSPPSLQPYYRIGTAAALKVVFVNNGQSPDRLISVRTSAATGWSYFSDYNDAFRVQESAIAAVTGAPSPSTSESASASESSSSESSSESPSGSSGSPSGSGSASDSSSGSASDTGSTSASPSDSASSSTATRAPQGTRSVTIPAGNRVGFGTPNATGALLLTGVTRALYPGVTIRVTFTFARAGTVAVAVPVQIGSAPRTAVAPGGGEDEPGS